MTTIVYCHKTKQVAVDGRATTSRGIISNDNVDKTVISDVGIWFIAGNACNSDDLIKLKHNDECKLNLQCSAILISNKEAYLVYVDEGVCAHEKIVNNEAMGSGELFALAALDFGQTAKQAVEYTATKDCYTGGNVRVFNLDGVEVL